MAKRKHQAVGKAEKIGREEENILFNIPLSIDGKQISLEKIEGEVPINIKGVDQPEIGRTLIYVSISGKDIFACKYFDGPEDKRTKKAEKCAADFKTKLASGEAKIKLCWKQKNLLKISHAIIEDKKPSK